MNINNLSNKALAAKARIEQATKLERIYWLLEKATEDYSVHLGASKHYLEKDDFLLARAFLEYTEEASELMKSLEQMIDE